MPSTNYSATILKPVVRDFGCRDRMPHDYQQKYDDSKIKVEICHRCGKQIRFKKHLGGRVDNRAYLDAHIRNFVQKAGRNKRLYMKIYKPEEMIITI